MHAASSRDRLAEHVTAQFLRKPGGRVRSDRTLWLEVRAALRRDSSLIVDVEDEWWLGRTRKVAVAWTCLDKRGQ